MRGESHERVISRRLKTMKMTCAVDEVRGLTANEIKAIMDNDKTGQYLLVDVRQPEEYEAGHIPGAVLIPLGELEARREELDRNKKIITYCRSGRRSMAAAIALCGLGFKGIQHLDGGILDWSYETITGIPERRPQLITEAADVKDILTLAIKLEKGSWEFYMAARDKVEQPHMKETFQTLVNAEEGHMRRLHQQAGSLLGEGILPSFDGLRSELKVEHMEGGIEINPALARLDENFADDMEALEIAIEKEYTSYDFYKRTAMLVENLDAKTLLHELALEERNHASILLKWVAEIARQR
jgi:rhodanese-related sulfurtransferase/rubrerythrin